MALEMLNESGENEMTYGKYQALLKDMLDSIEKSSAVFKSQQIDDPDLAKEDKRKMAETLLFENPVAFLSRFGRFLCEEHLKLFLSFKNDKNAYDIDHYVSQLQNMLSEESRKKITRNRRFEALKRLEEEGNYFSEAAMEQREPLLYHQLVGQYLSEHEKLNRFKEFNKDLIPSFSGFLIKKAERDALNDLRKQQEEAEAAQAASSDEELSLTICEKREQTAKWGADWEDDEADKKRRQIRTRNKIKKIIITPDEKALLLQEFRTYVYTKFLDGEDADYDYSLVDHNPEYDCLQVRSQDEEEKYFDEETCDGTICTDTGIEDY